MAFFDAKEKWDNVHILLYIGALCMFVFLTAAANVFLDASFFHLFAGALFFWLFLGLMPVTWSMLTLLILVTICTGYLMTAIFYKTSKSKKKKKKESSFGLLGKRSTSDGNIFNLFGKKKKKSSKKSSSSSGRLYDYYRKKYRL